LCLDAIWSPRSFNSVIAYYKLSPAGGNSALLSTTYHRHQYLGNAFKNIHRVKPVFELCRYSI
jgi:hypothetical protein